MKKLRTVLVRFLHPPGWILLSLPPVSFAVLAGLFITEQTTGIPACLVYGISAYSLAILTAAVPETVRKGRLTLLNSRAVRKLTSYKITGKYLNDRDFREGVGICRGMLVNFFYVAFRVFAGIRYGSAWFISMAVYYLVLGGLRTYLVMVYRRRDPEAEIHCYRRTAWLLFLLNITMGGMIFLMVSTDAGYSYPGYTIYLSALYTLYTMTVSVINLVKFRKRGSPVLSAAKVLQFIAAMMSVLGLQTAMISSFSENGEDYRRMMNVIVGGIVYGIVILLAVYMLRHSKTLGRKGERS